MKRPQIGKAPFSRKRNAKTSWEGVGSWYSGIVGSKGHYYHQTVIIPKLLPLLNLGSGDDEALLDLACGQGVLSRHLPPTLPYTGVDISPMLIHEAKTFADTEQYRNHHYIVGDISKKLILPRNSYSHITIILALQNIENGEQVIAHASRHLRSGGTLAIIINHPCFRVPRQSSWAVDEDAKIRYRRVDRYVSVLKVPIITHPSKGGRSPETYSYHHPLSHYCQWLSRHQLSISTIEEWCSEKRSSGKCAAMENRSRNEIPLFLALLARKSGSCK